jgi:GTP-binding protein
MPATFVKSAIHIEHLPRGTKPQVALLGRSNVGKSSFINHLAGAKSLARTSSAPGLTRMVNLYDFDEGFLLVDLPGYGYTTAKPSKIGDLSAIISEYLSGAEHLKLVLMLIDIRHGFTPLDAVALQELQESGMGYAVVLNKTDKISRSETTQRLKKFVREHPEIKFVTHSTEDNATLGPIRDIIMNAKRA